MELTGKCSSTRVARIDLVLLVVVPFGLLYGPNRDIIKFFSWTIFDKSEADF